MSDLAWPCLRNELTAAVTFTDDVAADGVRVLFAAGLVCGESGAATGVGVLRALGQELRSALGLSSTSRVLLFNTEGTTDINTTEAILQKKGSFVSPDQVNMIFVPHQLWK